MPVEVHISGPDTVVTALPLEPAAFAPFGSVVQNPKPHLHPSAFATAAATGRGASLQLPFHPVAANQGSAIKYQHVTHMLDLYAQAPSRQPGRAVMNMFVCAARTLDRKEGSGSAGFFPVTILERHPFTTQTFVPISTDPAQRYLVIVAPSLSPSQADEMLPVPSISSETRLPGRGLPDLRRLRAFVARVDQAVTCKYSWGEAPPPSQLPPSNVSFPFLIPDSFSLGFPPLLSISTSRFHPRPVYISSRLQD